MGPAESAKKGQMNKKRWHEIKDLFKRCGENKNHLANSEAQNDNVRQTTPAN